RWVCDKNVGRNLRSGIRFQDEFETGSRRSYLRDFLKSKRFGTANPLSRIIGFQLGAFLLLLNYRALGEEIHLHTRSNEDNDLPIPGNIWNQETASRSLSNPRRSNWRNPFMPLD